MRTIFLLFALAASAEPAFAQAQPEWRRAAITAGSWAYRELPTGSEAVFTDSRVTRRILVKCSRATRGMSLSVASAAAATSIQVDTTEMARSLPATFDPQGFQIVAQLNANDPLLDAIAFSRGRIAITVPGSPALVVPAWPEIARSIEDCRN